MFKQLQTICQGSLLCSSSQNSPKKIYENSKSFGFLSVLRLKKKTKLDKNGEKYGCLRDFAIRYSTQKHMEKRFSARKKLLEGPQSSVDFKLVA